MKKNVFLLVIISVMSLSIYGQVNVSAEKIVGDWKVIGGGGSGFDKEKIGTLFHFEKYGSLTIDEQRFDGEKKYIKQLKGLWEISKGQMILTELKKDNTKGDQILLIVKSFDENHLTVFSQEDEMTLTFGRVNN